jgi:hypothetical protein
MRNRRRPPATPRRPDLSVFTILTWADAHLARTRHWPNINSGRIAGAIDDTWHRIDDAIRRGYRGLPRNSGLSLARVLTIFRGVRNSEYPPNLNGREIAKWARAHHRRTGRWPNEKSGAVRGAPGETWLAIDMALRKGRRGLFGGSSLARLLEKRFGVRNPATLRQLQIGQILKWADSYHNRAGRWPNSRSDPVALPHGETWGAINAALVNGRRGLPPGSSLFKLLASNRASPRTRSDVVSLSIAEVLRWCRSHKRRSGAWPTKRSGPIAESAGDTWEAVDVALRHGYRGLPGGSSLAGLRGKHPHDR